MEPALQKAFDPDNIAKIKAAVTAAEQGNSGEVVPCIVPQSSHYEEVSVKAFFLAVMISAVALVIYEWKHDLWFPEFKVGVPIVTLMVLLAGGMPGYVLVNLFPNIKRKLLGKQRMSHASARHAKVMFLENEVFRTKQRVGILIFVSLFEHQVHVLPDKGLDGKVNASDWDEVVNLIITGIKRGDAAQGLIDGIQKCGEILRANSSGFSAEHDEDELSNELKIGKSDR